MISDVYTKPGATGAPSRYTSVPGESVRQDVPQIRKSSGSRTHPIFLPPLSALAVRITNLLTWPKEWDGYQLAPSRDAVTQAFLWIKQLYMSASTKGEWMDPLIVADAHGNVVFEWLNDHKRLVVYVSPTSVEYLKAWGPDIWSDMEDGEIEAPGKRDELWRWLTGQP
jgi:hypothetical protein